MTLGGDIKLFPRPIGTNFVGPADIEVVAGASDVTSDSGLETAVAIAVFTDARADDDDILPDENQDRVGWFGEFVLGEPFGSKLWLTYRSNLTAETLTRAKQYIEDALDRHIINENIAKEHTVSVVKENNRAKISIELKALDNLTYLYEYYINWQSQTGRI